MKHWWIPGKSSVSNLTAWYMTTKYSANILTIISCLLPSWKLGNISLVYSCGIKNTPKLYVSQALFKQIPCCDRPLLIYLLSSLHRLFLVFPAYCKLCNIICAVWYPLHEKKLTPPRLIDHISIYQPPIRLTVAPPRLSEGLQPVVRDLWERVPTFRGL